jgi:hypothetical protein
LVKFNTALAFKIFMLAALSGRGAKLVRNDDTPAAIPHGASVEIAAVLKRMTVKIIQGELVVFPGNSDTVTLAWSCPKN